MFDAYIGGDISAAFHGGVYRHSNSASNGAALLRIARMAGSGYDTDPDA